MTWINNSDALCLCPAVFTFLNCRYPSKTKKTLPTVLMEGIGLSSKTDFSTIPNLEMRCFLIGQWIRRSVHSTLALLNPSMQMEASRRLKEVLLPAMILIVDRSCNETEKALRPLVAVALAVIVGLYFLRAFLLSVKDAIHVETSIHPGERCDAISAVFN